jgi:group I intron endonuclease
MEEKYEVYKATNTITGKSYIGIAKYGMEHRKKAHLKKIYTQGKQPTYFHASLKKYGKDAFTWCILETCRDMNHLFEREKFYIDLLNTKSPNGYNMTDGGDGVVGLPQEVRDKIADKVSLLHKDQEYTSRLYPKLKGKVAWNKGKGKGPRQKKGYCKGEAHKEAHKDQYTSEVRAKMSAAKKGIKPKNMKPVECINTGIVYESAHEAARQLGLSNTNISAVCRGKLKSTGGLSFKFKVS